jgi:hypothetical protein
MKRVCSVAGRRGGGDFITIRPAGFLPLCATFAAFQRRRQNLYHVTADFNVPIRFVHANNMCNLGDFGIAFTSERSAAKNKSTIASDSRQRRIRTALDYIPTVMVPQEHSGIVDGDSRVCAVGEGQYRVKLADDRAVDIYSRRFKFRAAEVPVKPKTAPGI